MKKIILGVALGLTLSFGAYTAVKAGNGSCANPNDPCGGWVKINADGLVISGASVCTPSVCGDSNSVFSRLTLKDGEQWVQQTVADPVTGNVTGIGNNNPGTTVSYDKPSETFTVIIPTPAPTAAPVDTAPQPTSPPESNPQPTAEPTQAPAQPTPEQAPTQPAPEPTVVVAPTQAPTPIPQPTVDPSIIGYTFKLSDTSDGSINWRPLRRTWGEPYPI